jgi:hypothetical protein
MNKIELRTAVRDLLLGKYGPEEIEEVEFVGPDPGEPGVTLEVVTDDPYNLTDATATRRYRVTFEEID